MALTVKHPKTNNIPAWTQAQLDVAIASGQFPAGTTLNDITLSTDWNSDHTVTGTLEANQLPTGTVTGTGANGQVSYWTGSSTQGGNNSFFWDQANIRLGIGYSAPSFSLDVNGVVSAKATLRIDNAAAVSNPTAWLIRTAVEDNNPANTALYIHPEANQNPRIYLGSSTRPMFALNFRYCTAVEAMPAFTTTDTMSMGSSTSSHTIFRQGNWTYLRGTGSGGGIMFQTDSTFSNGVNRVSIDTNGKLTMLTGDIEFSSIGNGPIVRTPDGTKKYRITVDNSGNLVTTLVP